MVEPSQWTSDLFDLGDCYFHRDGISLDDSKGVVKELVAVFYRNVFQVHCVA